jgi:hypothetical protein
MRRVVITFLIFSFAFTASITLSLMPNLVATIMRPEQEVLSQLERARLGPDPAAIASASRVALAALVLPIVVLAGVSEALGQFYILFVNRVQPLRFAITIVINIVTFILSFFVTVFAVWLVGRFVFGFEAAVQRSLLAVGLSYQPLTLGFLSVLPYFGSYVMYLLYLATYILLAIFLVQLGFSPAEAFSSTVLALVVVYILRATVGRPVIWLGRRLRDLAAGTRLEKSVDDVLRYEGDFFVEEQNGR